MTQQWSPLSVLDRAPSPARTCTYRAPVLFRFRIDPVFCCQVNRNLRFMDHDAICRQPQRHCGGDTRACSSTASWQKEALLPASSPPSILIRLITRFNLTFRILEHIRVVILLCRSSCFVGLAGRCSGDPQILQSHIRHWERCCVTGWSSAHSHLIGLLVLDPPCHNLSVLGGLALLCQMPKLPLGDPDVHTMCRHFWRKTK